MVLGNASPKTNVCMDFEKHGVSLCVPGIRRRHVMHIRREASLRGITIEPPVFYFVNCSVPLVPSRGPLRR